MNYLYQLIYDLRTIASTDLCGHSQRFRKDFQINKIRFTYLLCARKRLGGRIIPLIHSFLKKKCAHKSESILGKFFTPFNCVAQGTIFSPLVFKIFLSDFLINYETKYEYADDSTSLCSSFEAVTQYENPEEFCKTWILVVNYTKTEEILLNTVEKRQYIQLRTI